MKEQEKYAKYPFEDFLQDDFFIESVKRPTEESDVFWSRFLEIYPEQTDNFQAARKFIFDLVQPQLSDEDAATIWSNIQMKIKSILSRGKMKKIVYASAAVAAGIALLLVVRGIFFSHDDQPVRNDILSFVNSQTDSVGNNSEIQLILSEEKTVVLQDRESVITYDSAGIQTGSEKILKNEVASYNQLVVPFGKSSVLTLHDGTKIWVNAGTKLVYPVEFEKEKREIYVNGEIFLDVASDALRPFVVRTNDLHIQVVGTQFNVQAYTADEQSRIALASGLVKIISDANGDVLLSPNELYEQDKSGRTTVKDADISQFTSWIYGMYIYESERLDVILKRLERYYGTEISVDPTAAKLRCTGKLDLKENVEDVLTTISHTAPVEYVNESKKYIVSYKPLK